MITTLCTFCVPSLSNLLYGDSTPNALFWIKERLSLSFSLSLSLSLSLSHCTSMYVLIEIRMIDDHLIFKSIVFSPECINFDFPMVIEMAV